MAQIENTKDNPATIENGRVSEQLSSSRDRATGKPMARIRVHNAMTANLAVGNAGCVVPLGWSEALVYESDIPHIKANLVEDDLVAWSSAQDSYLTRLAEDLLPLVGGWATKSASEMVTAIKEGSDAAVMEQYAKLHAITSQSPEGEFHRAKGRDVRPLRSVEVLAKGLSEPQQVTADESLRRTVATLASALSPQVIAALGAALQPANAGGNNRR